MVTDLVPVPQVPAGLLEAATRGALIPFVGAGASRIAGCPGWDDFADGVLRQLVGKGKLSYSQLDQIRYLNPRVKLSIATTIAADTKTLIDYDLLLHPRPRAEHTRGRRLYNSLFALGNIFVTTNYDRWLDDRITEPTPGVIPTPVPAVPSPVAPMHSIYNEAELLPSSLSQPNTVIHLHGSVANPDSMVITTRDYVRRYANDHRTGDASAENRTLTFLEHLFQHHTVLFVGYGLEELEILEYVILKAKPSPTRGEPKAADNEARHFLLQGFFSHQMTLLRNMESYYLRQCGIQLIPFLRDQRDHEQLLDVLEEFAQRMPASAPLMLEKKRILAELVREMEPLR